MRDAKKIPHIQQKKKILANAARGNNNPCIFRWLSLILTCVRGFPITLANLLILIRTVSQVQHSLSGILILLGEKGNTEDATLLDMNCKNPFIAVLIYRLEARELWDQEITPLRVDEVP